MKRLTYIVVILALIYSGYWVVGSYAVENAATTQLEKMEAEGWGVEYSSLKTRGFPSRFDTTVTDLNLSVPDMSLVYEAAIVQALALSYQPNRLIVAFPPEQTLRVNGSPILIKSGQLRASAGVAANTALSFNAITAEAMRVEIKTEQDGSFTLTNLLLAMRDAGTRPNTYDTYLGMADIAFPAEITTILDPNGALPVTMDTASIDAAISFDRPLDRHTMSAWEEDPAQLRRLTLRNLNLTWGAFVVSGKGEFSVDATGTPEGTITLNINDWKGLLALAETAGMVPDQARFMAQSAGQLLSNGETALSLPITVQNGNLSVGPLPLGPAPKLR